jgi:hypothetical protein
VVDVTLERPLELDGPRETQVRCAEGRCELYSRTGAEPWLRHAVGRRAEVGPLTGVDLTAVRARCPRGFDVEAHYRRLERAGIELGPAFRTLRSGWVGEAEALVEVEAERGFLRVDGMLQAALALVDEPGAWLPFALERYQLEDGEEQRQSWVWARRRPDGATDLTLLDRKGEALGEVRGLRLRQSRPARLTRLAWEPAGEAPPREPRRWWLAGQVRPAVAASFPQFPAIGSVAAARLNSGAPTLGATVTNPTANASIEGTWESRLPTLGVTAPNPVGELRAPHPTASVPGGLVFAWESHREEPLAATRRALGALLDQVRALVAAGTPGELSDTRSWRLTVATL